jgi:hypothetical protein
MENNFKITYNGESANVDKLPTNEKKETHYHIHFEGEELVIYKKEDNEGAIFWFDAKENITTDKSSEIGELIIEMEKES